MSNISRSVCFALMAVMALTALLATATPVTAASSAVDTTTAAAAVTATVEGKIKLPKTRVNGQQTAPSTSDISITLKGSRGEFETQVRGNHHFVFQHVPVGSYVLEVVSVGFVFHAVRIDVNAGKEGSAATTISASPVYGRDRLSQHQRLPHPLVLRPIGASSYFEVHPPWSPFDMLKNPGSIMMGVTLIIIVVFPKMLNNLDPEEREQMKKMSLTNMLKGDMPSLDGPSDKNGNNNNNSQRNIENRK
jgi:hypothetical protein